MTPAHQWRVERLSDEHDLNAFTCGEDTVDAWLRTQASRNAHLVSTYVCVGNDGEIHGFFALKNIVVNTASMNSKMRRGSDRDGRSVGILLAYMGRAVSLRGQGAGRALLREALRMALQNHYRIPVQLMIVDALNEDLVSYYEQAGFKRLSPTDRRLAAPMSVIESVCA